MSVRVLIVDDFQLVREGIRMGLEMESAVEIVPLPGQLQVRHLDRPRGDKTGWRAVAMERHPDGKIEYIVVKGSLEERVPAGRLAFEA